MGYSGSGQNRVGSLGGLQIFTANITAASATPTLGTNDSGPIGYGTGANGVTGVNSAQTIGFSKWLLQPIGTWGAGSAQVCAVVLATCDKFTTGYTANPNSPMSTNPSGEVSPTSINWFPVPAPSVETAGDSFLWANPLYGNNSPQAAIVTWAGLLSTSANLTDALYIQSTWSAIRVVVLTAPGAAGSPTNPNCNVLLFAVE